MTGPVSGPHWIQGDRVLLRSPRPADRDEFLAKVRASQPLHRPWVQAADDADGFRALLDRSEREDQLSLFGYERASGELCAVVNVNNIVRGAFGSGYLGFYAFVPFAGTGLTREAVQLTIGFALGPMGLHRVEANVQPANERSTTLVRRLGFRLEGFSPRYLHIDGAWRDHERYAFTVEDGEATRPS